MLDTILFIIILSLLLSYFVWFLLELFEYVKTFRSRKKETSKEEKTKEFYKEYDFNHRYRNIKD